MSCHHRIYASTPPNTHKKAIAPKYVLCVWRCDRCDLYENILCDNGAFVCDCVCDRRRMSNKLPIPTKTSHCRPTIEPTTIGSTHTKRANSIPRLRSMGLSQQKLKHACDIVFCDKYASENQTKSDNW